ncbi:hypothetical protein [Mycobacterium sp.]|uniref:hypothetical protein n=1 Tax=Mycobacterium sp. TaxID=1785 RepID=UPI0025F3F59E|nr:hypothetical protein [Mycobacterium sp.]
MTALAGVIQQAIDTWPNKPWLVLPGPVDISSGLVGHIVRAIDEAQTITTKEQLDAPELSGWGTLIMELHHPNDGCVNQNCWIVPVVWEMVNQVGWMCHNYRREDEEPHLPCRVIFNPA